MLVLAQRWRKCSQWAIGPIGRGSQWRMVEGPVCSSRIRYLRPIRRVLQGFISWQPCSRMVGQIVNFPPNAVLLVACSFTWEWTYLRQSTWFLRWFTIHMPLHFPWFTPGFLDISTPASEFLKSVNLTKVVPLGLRSTREICRHMKELRSEGELMYS